MRISDWSSDVCSSDLQAAAGVVGVSSGNHAQGVAWAAKRLGIRATIVMPSNAPEMKPDAQRALGAEAVLYDRVTESRDAVAAKLLDARGGTLVHAYENGRASGRERECQSV